MRTSVKFAVMSLLLVLVCFALSACTGEYQVQMTATASQINGAGATFPYPVYTEWIFLYKTVQPGVIINYQGIGSGGGKKGIIDRTIDFAGSDSLLEEGEYKGGGDLQMYPTLAGAVVPVYNIDWTMDTTGSGQELPTLILDRQTLTDIYLGKIVQWNDPAILSLNPDLRDALPAAPITTVHRSDGSGTTEIFTSALSAFSQEWATTVGAGPAVEWPVDKAGGPGLGGKGNQGVTAAIQNTPNSIGHIELSYAIANKITYARMVNRAGNVVTANADSLAAAMDDFKDAFTPELTAVIVDAPGERSWPIAGYTYIILHTQSMQDCRKAKDMLEFWHWALTDPAAAAKASELGYSVLPESVRNRVLDKLAEVTCQGNAVLQR